jgi:bifunctional non-homologous end joining protein LigD
MPGIEPTAIWLIPWTVPLRMKDVIPFRARPMLATLVSKPFDRAGWVYEEKYDGYRILAYKEGSKVTLLSRNNKDRSDTFPGVADAVAHLKQRTVLLDGEVIAFDRHKVSRFQLLQQGHSTRYAVFDCLYCNGIDLRQKPLEQRREFLEDILPKEGEMLISRRLASNGFEAFRAAKRRGFEGIVAKDNAAPYVDRRSTSWLKVKVHQEEEFVIGGFTRPEGSRQHLGALLLGAYDERRQLRYVGKVGTGFTRGALLSLLHLLTPIVLDTPPFADPPTTRGTVFVAPKLVAQIAFQEWTSDGKLRQPVYLGLRDDKRPQDVLVPRQNRTPIR